MARNKYVRGFSTGVGKAEAKTIAMAEAAELENFKGKQLTWELIETDAHRANGEFVINVYADADE